MLARAAVQVRAEGIGAEGAASASSWRELWSMVSAAEKARGSHVEVRMPEGAWRVRTSAVRCAMVLFC